MRKVLSRKVRWLVMLGKNNPNSYAKLFREQVLLAYCFKKEGEKLERIRPDNDAVDLFSIAMQRIYGDISGSYRGPHNLVDPEVLEKLRSNEKEAMALLTALSVHRDRSNILALQLISYDLDLPKPENIDEPEGNSSSNIHN